MSQDIGETAGKVWECLNARGETAATQLTKLTGCSKSEVDRAIGWLAREDKVCFTNSGKAEKVSLKGALV